MLLTLSTPDASIHHIHFKNHTNQIPLLLLHNTLHSILHSNSMLQEINSLRYSLPTQLQLAGTNHQHTNYLILHKLDTLYDLQIDYSLYTFHQTCSPSFLLSFASHTYVPLTASQAFYTIIHTNNHKQRTTSHSHTLVTSTSSSSSHTHRHLYYFLSKQTTH